MFCAVLCVDYRLNPLVLLLRVMKRLRVRLSRVPSRYLLKAQCKKKQSFFPLYPKETWGTKSVHPLLHSGFIVVKTQQWGIRLVANLSLLSWSCIWEVEQLGNMAGQSTLPGNAFCTAISCNYFVFLITFT